MYVRLGFSIAAHLEPDILLLDEVLAVGDAAFQTKCLDRINELQRQGRTIVFISHDLAAVERLCDRVLLLNRGQIVADGSARDVLGKYQNVGTHYVPSEHQSVASADLSRDAEITSVVCADGNDRPVAALYTGEAIKLRVSYAVHRPVADAIVEAFLFSVVNGTYGSWCQLTTVSSAGEGMSLDVGPGAVEFNVDELGLLPGMYYISATIIHADHMRAIDWQHQCLTLRVDRGKSIRGTFYMPHRWRAVPAEAQPPSRPRGEAGVPTPLARRTAADGIS
jgi:hypothetical protein